MFFDDDDTVPVGSMPNGNADDEMGDSDDMQTDEPAPEDTEENI